MLLGAGVGPPSELGVLRGVGNKTFKEGDSKGEGNLLSRWARPSSVMCKPGLTCSRDSAGSPRWPGKMTVTLKAGG